MSRRVTKLTVLAPAVLLLAFSPPSAAPVQAWTSEDGIWTHFGPPSARMGHVAVYDAFRRRMLVVGGDAWALALDGPPTWTVLQPSGTLPRGRLHHTVVHDPVSDRLVMYGGTFSGGPTSNTWLLTLAGTPTWYRLSASPAAPRSHHSAIYDPVRRRMIVFGGLAEADTILGDVWALSLSGPVAWSALATSGSTPPPLYGHTAVYDPVRDRMIVFGGVSGDTYSIEDRVWALDLATLTWTALAPTGSPGPRMSHTAVYDPAGDRMVVQGGRGPGGTLMDANEGWSLSLSGAPAWTAQWYGGLDPGQREMHSMVLDPIAGRVVMFGGLSDVVENSTWAASLAAPAWTPLVSTPFRAAGHGGVRDPVRDQLVVVTFDSQVWTQSLATASWTRVTPTGDAPPPLVWEPSAAFDKVDRPDFTLIYDPPRDRVILYGGGTRSGVWALSLAGTPSWSAVDPLGTPPDGRAGHSAVYDPVRDRMLVFAGRSASGLVNQVWAMNLSGTPAWSELAITGTAPVARWKHVAIYDPIGDRMVIHGGVGALSAVDDLADTWLLGLADTPSWTEVVPTSRPEARSDHSAIYDPMRQRMVVFGGVNRYFSGSGVYGQSFSSTWSLSLGGTVDWTELQPKEPYVRQLWQMGRWAHVAIFDASRDRMVVMGGESHDGISVSPVPDEYTLDFGSSPTSVSIALIEAHASPDVVRLEWFASDGAQATLFRRGPGEPWRERARLVASGDRRFAFEDREVLVGTRYGYRLELAGSVLESWIEVPRGDGQLELVGLTPNPARGALMVAFTLPDARPAEIELIDLAGRRVLRRTVTAAAGRHVLPLNAGKVSPGIYFVRLRHGDALLSRRGIVVE